jgi:hypothetical protein
VRIRTFTKTTEIPYVRIDGPPDARHLVVTFPKLRYGVAPPNTKFARLFEPLNAHRLAIGADAHTFMGPRRTELGMRTATALIRREAARLDVPLERVIAAGTSMGGVMALTLGLRTGVGHIVSGGPPVRMGTTLVRFAQIDGPSTPAKAAASDFLKLADNGDGKAVEWLDSIIMRRFRSVKTPTRVDLFVSPRDRTYKEILSMQRRLADKPLIDLRLTVAEYGRHSQILAAYAEYVVDLLMPICGPRPVDTARQAGVS